MTAFWALRREFLTKIKKTIKIPLRVKFLNCSTILNVLTKMNEVTLLDALILGIIEGLTEYLPVSSTGHLIIGSHFLGLESSAYLTSFEVVIQSGAILSVLIVYKDRFFKKFNLEFYKRIFWAFIPAAVIGLLLKNMIDSLLESLIVSAVTMVLGGFFLVWMERRDIFGKNQKTVDQMSVRDCLLIGLFQCLAMIPGTSRSGASIVGGLYLGLKKPEATEFSFFLGVPTLLGASVLKFKDVIPHLDSENIKLLGMGWLMSFIVGIIAIKGFIKIVSTRGFTGFGVYRILFGIFVLTYFW